jgi:hypothetical protein
MVDGGERDLVGQGWNDEAVGGADGGLREQCQTRRTVDQDKVELTEQRPEHLAHLDCSLFVGGMDIASRHQRRHDLALAAWHVVAARQDMHEAHRFADAELGRDRTRRQFRADLLIVEAADQLGIHGGVLLHQAVQGSPAHHGYGCAALEIAIDHRNTLSHQAAKALGNCDCNGCLAGATLEVDGSHHEFRQFDLGHRATPSPRPRSVPPRPYYRGQHET